MATEQELIDEISALVEWIDMTSEGTRMSEPVGEPNQWQVMAQKMLDETSVSEDLDAIRDGLFRQQMEESMRYPDGVAKWWKNLEAEWRAISGGKPIPTKYRTNKSVILKASRCEPDLLEWMDGGEVIGKTAVQTRCQTSDPVIRTPEAMCKTIVHMIQQYERQTDTTQSEALIELMYEWTKDRVILP